MIVFLTWFARTNLALALVVITWLAFTSSPPSYTVEIWDKASHFLAFFVLAGLADQSLMMRPLGNLSWLLCYGLFIEVGQWLLGYRFFELNDLVADLTGVLVYGALRTYTNRLPLLRLLHPIETKND